MQSSLPAFLHSLNASLSASALDEAPVLNPNPASLCPISSSTPIAPMGKPVLGVVNEKIVIAKRKRILLMSISSVVSHLGKGKGIMLTLLDKAMDRLTVKNGIHYLRCMDDMVIPAKTRRHLKNAIRDGLSV